MRQKYLLILPILLAALVFPHAARGQSASEYQVKAVFIYNFTQFIQWPKESFETPQDPFIIGVLGANVFGKYLEEAVAGETYQSRPIVIRYYNSLKDVDNCHILYVGSNTQRMKFRGAGPVLTVGESADFMEQEGMLRFYEEGNRIKIEINQSAASAAGLTISSKLLRLATIYQGK